jgi:hypothetical protein
MLFRPEILLLLLLFGVVPTASDYLWQFCNPNFCIMCSVTWKLRASFKLVSTPLPPYIFVHAPQVVCRSLDLRLQSATIYVWSSMPGFVDPRWYRSRLLPHCGATPSRLVTLLSLQTRSALHAISTRHINRNCNVAADGLKSRYEAIHWILTEIWSLEFVQDLCRGWSPPTQTTRRVIRGHVP